MLHYKISYTEPHHHFVRFELTIQQVKEEYLHLQLSAWRPGRYTLQHFAKNIREFRVLDNANQPISYQKLTKDRWKIDTKHTDTVKIEYTYYANQMDAGGCYVDATQLYLNFVCCVFEVEERKHDGYQLDLELPPNYQLACALRQEKHRLFADSYFDLIDSPLIASDSLQHKTYQVAGWDATFHIWIQGNWKPNWDKVLTEFTKFTKPQLDLFRDFPSKNYHFLFQILPYPKYHGVEHSHSTVIVLGADYAMDTEKLYHDFLGVSSHELFHFWNIMRIRPIEMMTYDFTQENYFKTGFVAEGITTYYGDLMLCRGGVWDYNFYLKEVEILLKRHYHNLGRLNLSVADSSMDLWLDGYELGIPNRKSSIYVEGAMAAIILDMKIRKQTQNAHSLDHVMIELWENHGKKEHGYSENDYRKIAEKVAQTDLTTYFDTCIYSASDLTKELTEAFDYVGLELVFEPNENEIERRLGLKTAFENGMFTILAFSPTSDAANYLTVGDKIISINSYKITPENINLILQKAIKDEQHHVTVSVFRDEKRHTIPVRLSENEFPIPQLKRKTNATEAQEQNLLTWLS